MKINYPAQLRMLLGLAVLIFIVSIGHAGPENPTLHLISHRGIEPARNQTANDFSAGPLLSSNGQYVAFMSVADDLVTNKLASSPLGNYLNVYVKDRSSGQIRLISVASDGVTGANGDSTLVGMSADGQQILIESFAENIVTNDHNSASDVFIRDWNAGKTILVSAGLGGASTGNGNSTDSTMTPDGRFVAFSSTSSDLINSDTNGYADVFVRDLTTGVTTLVSINLSGSGGGNENSTAPVISADGTRVAFNSAANNIGAGDRNKLSDLFVRDLPTGKTFSLTTSYYYFYGGEFALSANGRFVVFRVSNNTSPSSTSLYWYDLAQETSVLISQIPTNSPSVGVLLHGLDISEDGRYVIYDTDGQIFRWDSTTRSSEAVGLTAEQVSGVRNFIMTPDARRIVFPSPYTNSPNGEVDDLPRWYMRDMDTKQLWALNLDANSHEVAWHESGAPALSADGKWIGFESDLSDFAADDLNDTYDVFLRDVEAATNELVSASLSPQDSTSGRGSSRLGNSSVSAGGRFLVYYSSADDLVANDNNGTLDVFLFDKITGKNQLVSRSKEGNHSGTGPSFDPIISGDGQFVLFASGANDLTADDTNHWDDVFLWNKNDGKMLRAVIPGIIDPLGGSVSQLALNQDGRAAAFIFNKIAYYWNTVSGEVIQILPNGVKATHIALSPDGTKVAYAYESKRLTVWNEKDRKSFFLTSPTELLSTQNPVFSKDGSHLFFQVLVNHTRGIRSYDFETDVAKEVALVAEDDFGSTGIDVSASGRLLVFSTALGGLVANDTNGLADVFVLNTESGLIEPVSVTAQGGTSSTGASDMPAISADGRYVVFRSDAKGLVSDATIRGGGIFLRDLQLKKTFRITGAADGFNNGKSLFTSLVINDDGATVAFYSLSDDLVQGDINQQADVFYADLTEPLPVDTDGDGLPDSWEQQYFGSLLRDGKADFDGDGLNDLGEYLAGTDPTHQDSALRCAIKLAGQGVVRLEWNSLPGKRYRVQSRPDLGNGEWLDLSTILPADGNSSTFTISPTGETPSRYYRVVLLP